jgi:putative phage-type endonuclease
MSDGDYTIQGSAEWHAFRKSKIGSSDAPQICSVLPRFRDSSKPPWLGTPYQLWLRKTDRLPEKMLTPQMARGTRLEPQIRALVEAELGDTFRPVVLTHPSFDWMVASLDGHRVTIDLGEGTRTEVLEIKAPSREGHQAVVTGGLPPWYYLCQVMHQLCVSDATVGYYASYHPEAEVPLAIVRVERDEALIAELIEAEQAFWHGLKTDTPPSLTDRDERVRLDPEWQAVAEEYRKAEAIVSEWDGKRKAAREALIAMADGVPRVRGGGLLLSLSEKKGNVQYDRIPVLKGVNLDEFRGPARMEHRLTVEREK